MDRHKEIKTGEGNKMNANWQENVNIGARYAKNRQDVLNKLAELQEIWIDV